MNAEQYGWVWEPETKHLCSPPTDLRDHFEKALWRCAECDQYWEVFFNVDTAGKEMRLISPVDAALRMGQDPGIIAAIPGLEGRSEFATGKASTK